MALWLRHGSAQGQRFISRSARGLGGVHYAFNGIRPEALESAAYQVCAPAVFCVSRSLRYEHRSTSSPWDSDTITRSKASTLRRPCVPCINLARYTLPSAIESQASERWIRERKKRETRISLRRFSATKHGAEKNRHMLPSCGIDVHQ